MTVRRANDAGRREFLALTIAALAVSGSPAAVMAQIRGRAPTAAGGADARTRPSGGATFLSEAELRTLDELAETIIPADERSGGARAASVAAFIDARLAESLDPAWRQSWRDDLAEINRLSLAMFGRTFADGNLDQRTRLLESISRNERSPRLPGEFAFGTIKWTVAETYYRTRIGIHDEIGYKGNVLLDEFVGTDVSAPARKSPG